MGKKIKPKKQKKMSSFFIKGCLVIFVTVITAGIGQMYFHYQSLLDEQAILAAEIKAEKQRQLDFENRKEYYNSDSYIEQIAREQLGMIKPNEILYINRSQ